MLFCEPDHAWVGFERVELADFFGVVVNEVDPRPDADFEDGPLSRGDDPLANFPEGLRVAQHAYQMRVNAIAVEGHRHLLQLRAAERSGQASAATPTAYTLEKPTSRPAPPPHLAQPPAYSGLPERRNSRIADANSGLLSVLTWSAPSMILTSPRPSIVRIAATLFFVCSDSFAPWMNRIGAWHFFNCSSVTVRFLKLRPAAAYAFTSLPPYRILAIAFACSSVGFGRPGGVIAMMYDPRSLPSSTALAKISTSEGLEESDDLGPVPAMRGACPP